MPLRRFDIKHPNNPNLEAYPALTHPRNRQLISGGNEHPIACSLSRCLAAPCTIYPNSFCQQASIRSVYPDSGLLSRLPILLPILNFDTKSPAIHSNARILYHDQIQRIFTEHSARVHRVFSVFTRYSLGYSAGYSLVYSPSTLYKAVQVQPASKPDSDRNLPPQMTVAQTVAFCVSEFRFIFKEKMACKK